MLYLCPNHVKKIAGDPAMAMTLWHGAMDNGVTARGKADWTAARSFFGAAFETASLHLQSKASHPNNEFTLPHLLQASHNLSGVLQQLNLWEEAQLCLLTVQNRLLLECGNKSRLSHGSQKQVLHKTQMFVDELTGLFDFAEDETGFNQDFEQHATSTELSTLDTLIASTLYLMTRYALSPTEELRIAIADHLTKVRQFDKESKSALQKTFQRLHRQWQQMPTTPTPKNPEKSASRNSAPPKTSSQLH